MKIISKIYSGFVTFILIFSNNDICYRITTLNIRLCLHNHGIKLRWIFFCRLISAAFNKLIKHHQMISHIMAHSPYLRIWFHCSINVILKVINLCLKNLLFLIILLHFLKFLIQHKKYKNSTIWYQIKCKKYVVKLINRFDYSHLHRLII